MKKSPNGLFFLSCSMYRVVIETISAADAETLKKIQQKINQWITTGLLKKYDIHTTSEFIVFNILLNKEGE